MTEDDMKKALEVQRAAFTAALPESMAVRRDRLDRVIALLVDSGEKLVAAMSEDFGHRSAEQSFMTDITGPIRRAKAAKKHMAKWGRAEKRPLDFPLGLLGAKARVEYQPKGVVGIIVPWNFPVAMAFDAVIGAFTAGNRALVKASEFTPATSELMGKLAEKYFSAEELRFVNGGPDTGKAFSALPFDHLIFTGGSVIGSHVMRAASANLTPVTLELGGKSPVLVSRNTDIKRAAERVAFGKTLNAGQICLAPDYAMVPEGQEDAFVGAFSDAVASMYPTMIDNPDYTSVINARHRERLEAYLADAKEKGGDVVELNPGGEDFSNTNSNKMPVYLVRNPSDDMKVMQEEIFGPILPIKTVKDIGESIRYVNARPRPLGLYYFGDDHSEERQVLDTTISGGVTVNDVIFHVVADDLPFGGVGNSGMGAYHGIEGFRTFSHAKAVYRQPRINVAKLGGLLPPYGKTTHDAIKKDLKK